ncbi:hypothetical protein ACFYWX_38670 [Streptomyces sp. NPDC002888]|uniref:hypothetical protein n=1 Tax=Streptomyces sp. NPDC002888 TaxID=3364668 RepID=UPI0036B4D5F5
MWRSRSDARRPRTVPADKRARIVSGGGAIDPRSSEFGEHRCKDLFYGKDGDLAEQDMGPQEVSMRRQHAVDAAGPR